MWEPKTDGERNWKARAQRLKQTRATYRKQSLTLIENTWIPNIDKTE